MRKHFAFLTFVIISGCTTTSDIQSVGDGIFRVSSAACPACGGTAKSAELAIAEASEFCEAQELMMVSQGLDNENLNAFGAGGSFLEFRCSEIFNDDIVTLCYEEGRSVIDNEFNERVVSEVGRKMFPGEALNFGITQMADSTLVSSDQRNLIIEIGRVHEECQNLFVEAASPQVQLAIQTSLSEELENIVGLANGEITFGRYATNFNAISNKYLNAIAELNNNEIEQRRREQAERRQGINNLSNYIRGTNCTSTSFGNTVRTTCR